MPALRKSLLVGLLWALTPCAVVDAADRMEFWRTPRHGANSFNQKPPDREYFEALAATGATWVRLAFSKWEGEGPDFLLGDADGYAGLPAGDLATLRCVLDDALAADLGVVLTVLELPGARWIQRNGGDLDERLWTNRAFWEQAAAFWADVAREVGSHPAIIAFDLVNEPAPERTQKLSENASIGENRGFLATHRGTARDLPGFYSHLIAAIRRVDPSTPIMVEGGYYANPRNLAAWPEPLDDDRVLYSFHMYEPWIATSAANLRRDEPLRYPGVETEVAGRRVRWNAEAVSEHVAHAFDWAEAHRLPATRIVAGEFGCMRRWSDCGAYLRDVIEAVDSRGGHWAFYAFREDVWEGMDYELPPDFPRRRFYWLMERDLAAQIPRDGPLMDVLEAAMGPRGERAPPPASSSASPEAGGVDARAEAPGERGDPLVAGPPPPSAPGS